MGPDVDVLVRNARVYTVDEARPWAEAVAVRGERIIWVGDETDVREEVGSAREVIDAAGRLVLPGIVDSHNHVRLGSNEHAVQLAGSTSLEDVRTRISAWLEEHPDADWVEGEAFNYGALGEPRMPTADDLEGATGGRPAFIFTFDVHNVWMNREALKRLGVTRDTERLPFGTVQKDSETGEPTGMIGDFAVLGIERHGQVELQRILPGYSPERQYARLVRSLDMATEFGITTIVEPQNSVDDLPLFQRARDEGRLRSRLIAALFHPPGTSNSDLDDFADAGRRHDDDRFRVGPLKLYIDDVIEPHTAGLFEPYATEPRTIGETFYEAEEFAELITRLDARRFQTLTHSIGDRGIRYALDAHERARAVNGVRDARHQLVHVECPRPDDLSRFAELGVVACMQPRHWGPDLAEKWREAVGPEREAWAAPLASLIEAGAIVAFSSDWNVAEMDPLVGIHAALTRADLRGERAWGVDQTVDLPTAIRAYTMGGALANFCEGNRGSLTVGKYADMIMLSRNLFDLDPQEMLKARVDLTMVAGEAVHRRDL
jgi:predicted amidohydrolase YtcJ